MKRFLFLLVLLVGLSSSAADFALRYDRFSDGIKGWNVPSDWPGKLKDGRVIADVILQYFANHYK